jgi:hypothetical protein
LIKVSLPGAIFMEEPERDSREGIDKKGPEKRGAKMTSTKEYVRGAL